MPDDNDLVETLPTKELFVDVLTRDISLDDAVLDLVDNCIDGAKRLHPGTKEKFEERWVKIKCNEDSFEISDNCGGIDLQLAKNYAFRFGRDKKMAPTPNSIGQFGVGMKRALLRFGRNFEVQSVTEADAFKLTVDVNTWLEKQDWHFRFDETRKPEPDEVPGTQIKVWNLTDDAKTRFPLAEFQTSLQKQLEKNTQEYLRRGLSIELNGRPIVARPFDIQFSESLAPVRVKKTYFESSDSPVHAEFILGLGESSPSEAGWYVSCNGRIILSADQSKTTGWDSISDDGVPKYHNQFSRFRGYLLFFSTNAGKLPWNTMKTGVNPDSPIFQDARREMIALMRPIIDFLNRLDKEKDEEEDERELTRLVAQTRSISFDEAPSYRTSFKITLPKPPPKPKPKMVSIQFRRLKSEADELVDAMDANSARNAGEIAWEEAVERYLND